MHEDKVVPTVGAVNGHAQPSAPSEEWRQVEQAYKEIQRRDGSAEGHAFQWQRLAFALLALCVLTLGVIGWQFLHHRDVQAFVQVVQVDEKGAVVQAGMPLDLLAYAPEDGLWMDMLGGWVRRARWHGTDAVLAKAEWAWLYRHTCGQARRFLQGLEGQEKPFEMGKIQRTVDLKSVTKTPSPASYQVLWMETSVNKTDPTVKTQMWTGTFTVGRYRPPTLADTLENRLGLCVTAYDVTIQP
jgi:type IV secretory pathway TrbF-like protein